MFRMASSGDLEEPGDPPDELSVLGDLASLRARFIWWMPATWEAWDKTKFGSRAKDMM